MLLTITTTHAPATDLGYLLHKNPTKLQTFELSFGKAHVFYPEASEERCTAALLLDVDPVGLVRARQGAGRDSFSKEHYVSDRPYAASAFLSVAMARVFGSALTGRSAGRQSLAETPLPLVAKVSALPCRGGEPYLRALFEPLAYAVEAERRPLDDRFPAWGDSPYFDLQLTSFTRLSELLTHLYVLLPVLDDQKHYWVGEAEVEKLLRHGEGWLASHPQRESIAYRYLRHRHSLVRETLARLADEELDPDQEADTQREAEQLVERELSLNEERIAAVTAALKGCGARRVADLGCGEGRLIKALLSEPQFETILGLDVSQTMLARAGERLRLEQLPPRQRERVRLVQGALTYRDRRLKGLDAAAALEVVEHLDPGRLEAFTRVLFEAAQPGTVVLTTPNAEYNARFQQLAPGTFRHADHRFEWTRAQFQAWCDAVATRFGYTLRLIPIGPPDAELGSPSQMAVLTRAQGTP